MRLVRRSDRGGSYRAPKGDCAHVWRSRSLTSALSDVACDVCERCGVLRVIQTEEAAAPVGARRGAGSLQQEGPALGSTA